MFEAIQYVLHFQHSAPGTFYVSRANETDMQLSFHHNGSIYSVEFSTKYIINKDGVVNSDESITIEYLYRVLRTYQSTMTLDHEIVDDKFCMYFKWKNSHGYINLWLTKEGNAKTNIDLNQRLNRIEELLAAIVANTAK